MPKVKDKPELLTIKEIEDIEALIDDNMDSVTIYTYPKKLEYWKNIKKKFRLTCKAAAKGRAR